MKIEKLSLIVCVFIIIFSSFLTVSFCQDNEVEDIKPSYYDDELKKLAEKMKRLIEKTESKAGKAEKKEVIKKKYFEEDQKLEEIAARKRKEEEAEKIRIEKEKIGIEKEKIRIEKERIRLEKEKIRLGIAKERVRLEKEKIRLEEKIRIEKEKQQRLEKEAEARRKVDKEAKLAEQQKLERKSERQRIKMHAWTGGIIFISTFLIVLLALLLRKPGKEIKPEIKPPEVKSKKQKIFEQARPEKGIFRARKLRDVMKKKRKEGEGPPSNDKRKNLFDRDK